MQYALLIYTKPGTVEALSPEEVEELSRDYYALRDEPGILGGAGLQPVTTATTLRLADGKPVVTDGPFADTKEVFGGYYLYECDNLDQATEMAARIPALRIGGTVEIRPVMGKANLTPLEQVFRDEWGRVLAVLVGYLGDFELAEESVAEAFAVAARRWPAEGTPASPVAWLVTTARNRAIDRLRRDRVLAAKLRLLEATTPATVEAEVDETEIPDERLELIFTCCHPAIAVDAQVALTLRAVAGLATDEIARAFLVPGETMKRRLTRAKTKIRDAGIPFSVPEPGRLEERLAVVLAVIYLIFNQGYSAPGQAGHLAAEAIRLGRVLAVAAARPDRAARACSR